ncbi:MAG TPA: hypothetical protein VMU54_02750 [Planctomycetota bacterium]|nr:hypothetical protein [Planctomycetota bacterium]
MNWRSIGFKVAPLGFLVALFPGCGGDSQQTVPDTVDGLAILKITYFRSLPEAKTRRPEPTFRAVMSESWRDRVANGPREPLAKAAPGRVYMGYISDSEMFRYVKRLREMGIDDLKASKPENYDPDTFARMAVNPTETSFTRVFTVGDDKSAKSYYYRDQQTSPELIQKFVKCEAFVARACENSINVSATTDQIPGRLK